jgi:isopenicillin-N epimerase
VRSAAEIRNDFLLDPNVVFLNHGSFGATPQPVLDRQADLRRELERRPVEFLARRLPAVLDGARTSLARYLGVVDPVRLVLLRNSTTASNAVAASVPLNPGDEVVITDLEYGAMALLWREIAGRTGVRIVTARVPLPVSGSEEIVDAVWGAVNSRTRVIFFSHITSETALVFPASELCRPCIALAHRAQPARGRGVRGSEPKKCQIPLIRRSAGLGKRESFTSRTGCQVGAVHGVS